MDNEYAQTPEGAAYFQALVDAFKDSPIVVPLTYNDPHAGENFINGTVRSSCSHLWHKAESHLTGISGHIRTGRVSATIRLFESGQVEPCR